MLKPCSNTKMIKSPDFMVTVVSDECDTFVFMIQPFEPDSMLRDGIVEVNHAIGLALAMVDSANYECANVNVYFNYCFSFDVKLSAISLSAAIVAAYAEKGITVSSIEIKDN